MKKMADFDKESFKKDVINNVKNLFRKTIDEATQEQVFQAVSYAVKDHIIDRWIATQKAYEEKNAKTVYYLSMEFLMGRAVYNNLLCLGITDEVDELLKAHGRSLNDLEERLVQRVVERQKLLHPRIFGHLSETEVLSNLRIIAKTMAQFGQH